MRDNLYSIFKQITLGIGQFEGLSEMDKVYIYAILIGMSYCEELGILKDGVSVDEKIIEFARSLK